jgi:HlyD family secretion protein
VEDARVNLSRCTIYAPIDGVVMQRATEVGKTVAASLNAPTLFVIANELAKMQIVAAVAEADVGKIEEKQNVTFIVDAYPTREFRGRVSQIRNYPKTASNVVTYETIIDVSNEDLKLKPGMTANVSIIVAERKGALRIPNAALRARVPEEFLVSTRKAEAGEAKAAAPAKEITPEERRKIMQEIFAEVGFSREGGSRPTPEQLAKVQELAKARGIEFDPSRMGGGGRRGERNSQASSSTETTPVRTVFRLLPPLGNKPQIEAVSIKTGITDSMSTEVIEGLKEGDTLVTTMVINGAAPGAQAGGAASNPFAPRTGGPGGGGGGRR